MSNDNIEGPVLPEAPPLSWDCLAYSPAALRAYGRQCAEHVAGPLREQLAKCFNLGGAGADGNGTQWRAARAVRSVHQLRHDYNEACDEDENLREALSECATAVGAGAAPDCSVEFLCEVPREVELVVSKLRERVAELELDLRISREASRCLQSELDRLRAEIEALPKVLDTYEAQTKALPVQYEIPERGCSTYNWRMAVIRDLRSMIDAARAARQG